MAAITATLTRKGNCLYPATADDALAIGMLQEGLAKEWQLVEKKRTNQQNKAIRMYCKLVADAMREGGFDIQVVIGGKVGFVSVTPDNVLETIWRVIQVAMGLERSTTKLTTSDVNAVYAEVSRFLAESFGIDIPFPSKF